MNPQQTPADLNLHYLVPIVTSDGNGVFIRDGDDAPILTFFQVRNQTGNTVEADVVAAVNLGSLETLEQLKTSIEETIQNHRNKEK